MWGQIELNELLANTFLLYRSHKFKFDHRSWSKSHVTLRRSSSSSSTSFSRASSSSCNEHSKSHRSVF